MKIMEGFMEVFNRKKEWFLGLIRRILIFKYLFSQKKIRGRLDRRCFFLFGNFFNSARKRAKRIKSINRRKKFVVLGISIVLLFVAGLAVAGVIGSFSTGDLNKGLVGHWPLDGAHLNSTTNRVDDISGYGNHGTNSGASLTTDRYGQANGAMSFDGSNYIQISEPLNQENLFQVWSISAWININIGDSQYLISGLNRGISLHYYTTNKLLLYLNSGDNDYYDYGNYNLQNAGWKHVVFVFENTTGLREIYVNNVDVSSTGPNKTSTPSGINSLLNIGTGVQGKIQDVRIYNRVLSGEEIKKLYETYKPKFSVGSASKGLVGHWPLRPESSKSSTVTADITPYGNDGTIYGVEIRNHGASFNGSSDYVDLGDKPSLESMNTLTVAAWVKTTTTETNRAILAKWYTGTISYSLRTNTSVSGKIDFHTYVSGSQVSSSSSLINDGNWHHLVGVYNGTTQKLYINGVEEDSDPQSGAIANSEEEVCVGVFCNGETTAGYFSGNIADVLIYNRALSVDEVLELYHGADVVGAVLNMPLSNKTGFKDISGNNNHGTNYGADIIGEAGGFDGSDDKMEFLNISLSTATYSFWMKPNNLVGERDILCSSDTSRRIQLMNDYIRIETDTNGQYFIFSSVHFNLNEWVHVIVSRDGNDASIYKDGVFMQTVHTDGADSLTINNIGGVTDDYRKFSGQISDVRVYNRTLSDGGVSVGQDAKGEIGFLYAKGRGGSSVGISTTKLNKGLIGQWDLKSKNEKVGSELHANWDMENGISSWAFDSKTDGSMNSEISDYLFGAKSIRIKNSTINPIAFWDPPSGRTIGSLYRVSVWAKNIDCPTIPYFSSSGATRISGDYFFSSISTSEWKYYSAIFEATASTPNIYIRTGQNASQGEFLLDNFSLKPIDTADSTPYGNHGTIYGATVGDNYTNFDGDDYVNTECTDSPSSITVTAWVKSNSISGEHVVVSKNYAVSWEFGTTGSNALHLNSKQGGVYYSHLYTGGSLIIGEWTFIAWAKDARGGDNKFYQDGSLIGTVNKTGGIDSDSTNIKIGRRYTSSLYWDGDISNVKIYDRVLSPAEVKLLYDKGR